MGPSGMGRKVCRALGVNCSLNAVSRGRGIGFVKVHCTEKGLPSCWRNRFKWTLPAHSERYCC